MRAFQGLDLGDTGYHLFSYINFSARPDLVNPTGYLSTLIGHLWYITFGGLGLVGFNMLEVILELCLAYIVYHTLKDVLGDIPVLIGLLMAILGMGTYLSIYNYHQLNVFLSALILILQIQAIYKEKYAYSFFAGIATALVFFARVASIVAVVSVFIYIYDGIMHNKTTKETLKHILYYALGGLVCGIVFIGILKVTGYLWYFVTNLFRLKGIASSGHGGYSMAALTRKLFIDSLKTIASGMIFLGSSFVLLISFNILAKKFSRKSQKYLSSIIAVIFTIIALYMMRYAYSVNPSEKWAQLTTGPRFVLGLMLLFSFLNFSFHAFKEGKKNQKITLLSIASVLLIVFTIAGSNTGTKHSVLAYWFIAPLSVYFIRELYFHLEAHHYLDCFTSRIGLPTTKKSYRAVLLVVIAMFSLKFFHMIYYTLNFDEVNRFKLVHTVDHPKLRLQFTTKRRAESVQGVLDTLDALPKKNKLIVYGNSMLYYYASGREPYTRAWVTQGSIPKKVVENDLLKSKEEHGDELPIFLYCRTQYNFGFDEEDARKLQKLEEDRTHSGKKQVFLRFLRKNRYKVQYVDDYHVIMVPGGIRDDFLDINFYMTGEKSRKIKE